MALAWSPVSLLEDESVVLIPIADPRGGAKLLVLWSHPHWALPGPFLLHPFSKGPHWLAMGLCLAHRKLSPFLLQQQKPDLLDTNHPAWLCPDWLRYPGPNGPSLGLSFPIFHLPS